MKILVAADGSSFTKRMLAYLAAHDEWLGAHHAYTVLTVVPPVPARAASVLSKDVLTSYYNDESEKVFKPIRPFFAKQGLNAEFVAKHGITRFHDVRGDEGGICHQILPENGYVRPGAVVVAVLDFQSDAEAGRPFFTR